MRINQRQETMDRTLTINHQTTAMEVSTCMSGPCSVTDRGTESTMSEKNYTNVFSILVKHRALPFLKLCTLSELDESQVRQIVDELETRNMVRVTEKGNPFKEIVTVREAAFAAGRGLGD
jgi:hypothetical protein